MVNGRGGRVGPVVAHDTPLILAPVLVQHLLLVLSADNIGERLLTLRLVDLVVDEVTLSVKNSALLVGALISASRLLLEQSLLTLVARRLLGGRSWLARVTSRGLSI